MAIFYRTNKLIHQIRKFLKQYFTLDIGLKTFRQFRIIPNLTFLIRAKSLPYPIPQRMKIHKNIQLL